MNDASISRVVSQMPISTTSSKGAESNTNSLEAGKKLPPTEEVASNLADTRKPQELKKSNDLGKSEDASGLYDSKESKEAKAEQLEAEVASMNEYVQSVERDLQFSIDEESEQTVVRVIDSGSGNLVRQIPEETFLEIARQVKENGEFQLVNATG